VSNERGGQRAQPVLRGEKGCDPRSCPQPGGYFCRECSCPQRKAMPLRAEWGAWGERKRPPRLGGAQAPPSLGAAGLVKRASALAAAARVRGDGAHRCLVRRPIYIHTYVCMYVYIYIYTYIYMDMYIQVYIHISNARDMYMYIYRCTYI